MIYINTTGIYRSGTTLVYNIVRKIIETISSPLYRTDMGCMNKTYKIHKKHEDAVLGRNTIKPSEKTIYSYRDLRDVVASFCIKRNMNINNFNINGQKVIRFIECMIKYDKAMMKRNNILVLRYEKDIMDIKSLIPKIVNFLNVKINIDDTFINCFTIESIKKHIENIKTPFDRDTLFWQKHISDAKIGKWQNYFTKKERAIFNNNSMLCEWNKIKGYN